MKDSEERAIHILVTEALMRSKQEELDDIRFDIRELHKLLSDPESSDKEIDATINEIIANLIMTMISGSSLMTTIETKLEDGVSPEQIIEVLDPQSH